MPEILYSAPAVAITTLIGLALVAATLRELWREWHDQPPEHPHVKRYFFDHFCRWNAVLRAAHSKKRGGKAMQSNKNAEITSYGGEALRMNDEGRLQVDAAAADEAEEPVNEWDTFPADEDGIIEGSNQYIASAHTGCYIRCPKCGEMVESMYTGFDSQEEADLHALALCPHCREERKRQIISKKREKDKAGQKRKRIVRYIVATAATIAQSAIVTVMAATDPDRNIARLALSLFCSMVVWASCIGGWMADKE